MAQAQIESRLVAILLFVAFSVVVSCRPRVEAGQRRALPRIGLAVSDSARAWCAAFITDSTQPGVQPGQRASIVFAGPAAVTSLPVRVNQRLSGECPAAFPQPRWIDYVAYRVDPLGAASTATDLPTVALIVAGEAAWSRGTDGVPRSDIDGDGTLEEVRRCTADEGEHFTVWTKGRDGASTRRWHEYYDWGGFTDPTCRPGEDGRP